MSEIDLFESREREVTDLRRHWRAMGLCAAWRATLAWMLGQHLIGLGGMLLLKHSSKTTFDHFDRLATSLHIDTDAANEGLEERRDLLVKNSDGWRGKWH